MVTYKCHVTSQWSILCEPSMDRLCGVVLTRLSGRFNYASWAEERVIDKRVMEHVCVSVSLFISRSALQESVSFWNNCFVVVKSRFKSNWVTMLFGVVSVIRCLHVLFGVRRLACGV